MPPTLRAASAPLMNLDAFCSESTHNPTHGRKDEVKLRHMRTKITVATVGFSRGVVWEGESW